MVGAGISGACLALELARRGDPPLLIEGDRPGCGATGRNAGFLLAESECFGLAERAHGVDAALALRAAGVLTREIVRELTPSGGRPLRLRWPGSLRLAEDAGERRAFVRSAERLPDLVGGSAAAHSEAGHAPDGYSSALVDPNDGVVDPLRLLARVLRTGADLGVIRHDASPVREVRRRRGVVELVLDDAVVRAERVVLATNAALRLVVRSAAGIRPVRAQALVARVEPAPAWRRPVYATRGGDYWRPLPGGRVLVGGLRRLRRRAENTRDASPTPELQRALDALLRRLVGPAAAVEVTHRWAGTMAFTPGGLPWVGALPRRLGVFVLAGMNGHGMGWAPGMARRLAEHLTGSGPPPATHFRPGS